MVEFDMDPAVIAIYVLLAATAVGVWWANRQAKKASAADGEASRDEDDASRGEDGEVGSSDDGWRDEEDEASSRKESAG